MYSGLLKMEAKYFNKKNIVLFLYWVDGESLTTWTRLNAGIVSLILAATGSKCAHIAEGPWRKSSEQVHIQMGVISFSLRTYPTDVCRLICILLAPK